MRGSPTYNLGEGIGKRRERKHCGYVCVGGGECKETEIGLLEREKESLGENKKQRDTFRGINVRKIEKERERESESKKQIERKSADVETN